MKSSALKLAHQIKANFSTWSEALKCAWKKVKIQFQLRAGKVSFMFIKKNGEERPANGTTKFDGANTTSSKPSPWWIVKYFDLDKDGWRSFDIRTLQKIY